MFIKNFADDGFRTGIGNDRFANWATTTAHI